MHNAYVVTGTMSDSRTVTLDEPLPLAAARVLTRLECRVKHLKTGDTALLQDFDDYFTGAITEVVTLSSQVMDRATDIRARHGFKTPDAIHLAAALVAGCDVFLTNDHRLA